MKTPRPRTFLAAFALALLLATPPASTAQEIPSPEAFFGFRMGADRKLARWDKLVEYYRLLDRASDRIHVVEMGPSTLGNPFLAVWVSSPENLANLDEIQRMNALLSDPRGATQADIDAAIRDSKAVVVPTGSTPPRWPRASRRRRSCTRWRRATTTR